MCIPRSRPRSGGFSRLDRTPVVGRHCRYRALGVITPAGADAAAKDLHTPVDRARPPALVPECGKRSNTHPERRQSRPSRRAGRPSAAILGHLDALYALAYLSSGDADGAQDVVIEAFKRIGTERLTMSPGRSRIWRTLADHVHWATQQRAVSLGSDRGPFREGRLSSDQQEAIALLLVDGRDTKVACLLGISPGEVRSQFGAGLTTLQAMWFPMSPAVARSAPASDSGARLKRGWGVFSDQSLSWRRGDGIDAARTDGASWKAPRLG